jgi:hypothetical protein
MSNAMAVLLLTVEFSYTSTRGLTVLPCLNLKALASRAEFSHLQQGSPVELRRPDGSYRMSRIETYGVPAEQGSDGQFYIAGGPDGPEFEIRFALSPDLSPEDVPVGTEVWYLNEGQAEQGAAADRGNRD